MNSFVRRDLNLCKCECHRSLGGKSEARLMWIGEFAINLNPPSLQVAPGQCCVWGDWTKKDNNNISRKWNSNPDDLRQSLLEPKTRSVCGEESCYRNGCRGTKLFPSWSGVFEVVSVSSNSLESIHIGAQVFFRLFWWDFRWFTFFFTFFGDFSSEIFGDSPFSSPFLVTFPVMNFAIHYIHHRFWWLSCHLFCHFDISLSFYLFWPFFRWPFWQPYKFITIFGASLVTFFVLIFFLPFYSPFLGDFFGDRSFYPTHLSVSLLLCLRGSVKEFKTFFSSILQPFPTRVHKFLSVVYLVVLPPIMF